MFPLPRIIYAMASDGLIFKLLGRVNQRFSTPVIGTFAAGILTGTCLFCKEVLKMKPAHLIFI